MEEVHGEGILYDVHIVVGVGERKESGGRYIGREWHTLLRMPYQLEACTATTCMDTLSYNVIS